MSALKIDPYLHYAKSCTINCFLTLLKENYEYLYLQNYFLLERHYEYLLDLGVIFSVFTLCKCASYLPKTYTLDIVLSGQREPATGQFTSQSMQRLSVGPLMRGSLLDCP